PDSIHCCATKMSAYAAPIWRKPASATNTFSREVGRRAPRWNANGASSRQAKAIRKPANESGGRYCSPILMTSQVDPQIAQRKQYTARGQPRNRESEGHARRSHPGRV